MCYLTSHRILSTVSSLFPHSDLNREANLTLVLAWNGGGKSNFSDIINEGGYDMKSEATPDLFEVAKSELKSELKDIVSELESLIESA